MIKTSNILCILEENGVLICNKNEQYRGLIELLYESKKRTGGEDIKELHFDKALNQYICIYSRPETSRGVLTRGAITFNQTVFSPMEIDRSKIMLENVDETLELDVVSLYAEYLFQPDRRRLCSDPAAATASPTPTGSVCSPKVERLRSGFVLVDLEVTFGKLFSIFLQTNRIKIILKEVNFYKLYHNFVKIGLKKIFC